MGEKIAEPARKSTFRRLDKYLYVARTTGYDPATVIAVCVMANSGRAPRRIAKELGQKVSDILSVLDAAEPFLRKRRNG
jgi:hypothetical protein